MRIKVELQCRNINPFSNVLIENNDPELILMLLIEIYFIIAIQLRSHSIIDQVKKNIEYMYYILYHKSTFIYFLAIIFQD